MKRYLWANAQQPTRPIDLEAHKIACLLRVYHAFLSTVSSSLYKWHPLLLSSITITKLSFRDRIKQQSVRTSFLFIFVYASVYVVFFFLSMKNIKVSCFVSHKMKANSKLNGFHDMGITGFIKLIYGQLCLYTNITQIFIYMIVN